MLMLLSVLPASFAEELLGEVIVADEVAGTVPAEDNPALSGGVVDFLSRLKDCRHSFQAVKADEAGSVTVHGVSVNGTVSSGAWMLSKDTPLTVCCDGEHSVSTIILYFSAAMIGQLDKDAVEAALSVSLSSTVEFSALGNCAVINGAFCPESVVSSSSESALPVVKVEAYTKEHFDADQDGYCDLCGADTYTVVRRTVVTTNRAVDLVRRLSELREAKDSEKTREVLDIVFGSISALFRVVR